MIAIQHILQQYWGYDSFRPLQEDIIQWALTDQDALALLPTGGGKSLCFQVPALARDGITIVVSPLIALMKDQVFQLNKRGIVAKAIFSGMSNKQIDQTLDNAIYGNTKLLYVSPERLATPLFQARFQKMKVNLIAVDEAHCISQWGYDFRPAYLNVLNIREFKPKVPVLALTATATPDVVEDIQEKLGFRASKVFQKSFLRSNLSYSVFEEPSKLNRLLKVLKGVPGSSVVYVRSRRRTKEIAIFLQRNGIKADFYHAGLEHDQRSEKQEAWIKGQIRVIVATNAFGMGIDKSDVRTVIHMDVPNSLEAYFQEAGRAGRDGEKAYAVLLYQGEDLQRLEQQHEKQYPDMAEIRRVYSALGSYYQLAIGSGKGETYDLDIKGFAERFSLDAMTCFHALKIMQDDGWFELTESVFIPSNVKIRVNKEELYAYQLEQPALDLLIKSILRTSPGVFTHQSRISEHQLAKFLRTSVERIIAQLEKMQREGILDYRPRKDKPQLFWLKERQAPDNLTIDHQRLTFLKARSADKLEAVIRYVQSGNTCRSQQLLAYFGELESAPCGVCDVCLEQRKNRSEKSLEEEVKALLNQKAYTTEQLVQRLSRFPENLILEYLQFALQEGQISLSADQLLSWRS